MHASYLRAGACVHALSSLSPPSLPLPLLSSSLKKDNTFAKPGTGFPRERNIYILCACGVSDVVGVIF